jgi:hypothetical protein
VVHPEQIVTRHQEVELDGAFVEEQHNTTLFTARNLACRAGHHLPAARHVQRCRQCSLLLLLLLLLPLHCCRLLLPLLLLPFHCCHLLLLLLLLPLHCCRLLLLLGPTRHQH